MNISFVIYSKYILYMPSIITVRYRISNTTRLQRGHRKGLELYLHYMDIILLLIGYKIEYFDYILR